jgi:hypothetical protein
MASVSGSAISNLLSAIASASSNSGVANAIGSHMQQQNNTATSIRALLALATPANASNIATQIAALPGVPSTVSPLLQELASAKDQPTITTIELQIEATLSSNSNALGGILAAL